MSVQWILEFDSSWRAEDAREWLLHRSEAVADTDTKLVLLAGVVSVDVSTLKPYETTMAMNIWGVPAATLLWMDIYCSDTDRSFGYSIMYKVAIDALNEFPGDMVFAMLDIGIFARRSGRLVVNVEQFKFDMRLLKQLPQPYDVSDPDTELMVKDTQTLTSGD